MGYCPAVEEADYTSQPHAGHSGGFGALSTMFVGHVHGSTDATIAWAQRYAGREQARPVCEI
jgi:hypothetical protein